jgi:hypothetical protein
VFRLQGNLPFSPKPKNPDEGGTLSLLLNGDHDDWGSPISTLSDLETGTGMGTGTGGKPRITPPAVCCKGDGGYSIPSGSGADSYAFAYRGAELFECACERVWRRERDSLPAFVTSAGGSAPAKSGARPASSGKGANVCCCCRSSCGGFGRGLLREKLSIDVGKLRAAYSGLRRSKRRCVLSPEEGGVSSGDYKMRASILVKIKEVGCTHGGLDRNTDARLRLGALWPI